MPGNLALSTLATLVLCEDCRIIHEAVVGNVDHGLIVLLDGGNCQLSHAASQGQEVLTGLMTCEQKLNSLTI
jgi:hypothetical protein